MARLTVKVIPGGSRDEVVGWLGDVLKVKVRAQPEKGKANVALAGLLAGLLGVPAREVSVVVGQTARNKVVEIPGLSDAELYKRLARDTALESEGGDV